MARISRFTALFTFASTALARRDNSRVAAIFSASLASSAAASVASSLATLAFSSLNRAKSNSTCVNRFVVGPRCIPLALTRTLANDKAMECTCHVCNNTAASATTTTHAVATMSGTVVLTAIDFLGTTMSSESSYVIIGASAPAES